MGIGDNSPQQGYCVYMHLNRINNKVYVGISKNVKQRWAGKTNSYKGSPIICNALKKYGWDNFAHVVLHDKLTKEEALDEEKMWIAFFRLCNKRDVYNVTDGGEGGTGIKYSEERKQRIREWLTGRPCSPETRKKISESNKGKKGKPIYAFNAQTMAFVKKYPSIRGAAKELCLRHTNISRAALGKTPSAGGYIWSFYPYITLSDNILSKIRDTRVFCYDLDGNYVKTYKSAVEAAKAVGGHSCPIGECCSKNRLSYKGYIWRRSLEEIDLDVINRIRRKQK